jgi:hypothetical protein
MLWSFFLGIKQPEREAEYCPFSIGVKDEWSHTYTPPYDSVGYIGVTSLYLLP